MRPRLEARQRLVSRLDPNHPTWAVLYQVDDLYGYLHTADVLGTDPYPVPDRPVTLGRRLDPEVARGLGWLQAALDVPQAFDWASYRKTGEGASAYARRGTGDDVSLPHSRRARLIYYSYADLLRDPKVGFDQRWADLLRIGQEVKHWNLSYSPPRPHRKWRSRPRISSTALCVRMMRVAPTCCWRTRTPRLPPTCV